MNREGTWRFSNVGLDKTGGTSSHKDCGNRKRSMTARQVKPERRHVISSLPDTEGLSPGCKAKAFCIAPERVVKDSYVFTDDKGLVGRSH